MIRWIAFDADDTLWENEKYYHEGQRLLAELLAPFQPAEVVDDTLLSNETANLPWYGYGIKAFGISMIETAIQLSAGQVGSREVSQIIQHLRRMLAQPTELLPGVLEVINELQHNYQLMVITKGDLLDQERKLTSSNLSGYFKAFEVVSNKVDHIYERILQSYRIQSSEFMMVGNSLKSDVLPVLKLGGFGVYVPHQLTWAHEMVQNPQTDSDRFVEIQSIRSLPDVLSKLNSK